MSASSLVRPSLALRTRTQRTMARVAALSAAVLLLAACGEDNPEVSGGTGDVSTESVETGVPVEVDDTNGANDGGDADQAAADAGEWDPDNVSFPNCELIARQVATGLETLELAAEDVHTAEHAMDSSHKTCTWVTEMYEDLENADANTLMEALHTGALTMSINVAPQALSEEDAALVGYAFHDLRAEQVDGYVFAPEDTDLNEPLGLMGVTVTVDRVDVTWGGGTYFDGQGDQIAEQFNKDWGVDAAVTVHRLIWE